MNVFLYNFVLLLSVFLKAFSNPLFRTDPYIQGRLKVVPLLRYKRLVFNEKK